MLFLRFGGAVAQGCEEAFGEVRLERADGTRPPAEVELAFFRVNSALGFVVFAMIITGAIVR